MIFNRVKSFIVSHKSVFILLAIIFLFALFNFISHETFVRTIPMGQGLPMEGQTIYGCKSCSFPLGGFLGGGGCSTNIFPNCPMEFITEYFIGYAIIAVIIGLIIDWIIKRIKSTNQNKL